MEIATGGGEVNAIGGVLPYSYFWPSTGATTNITSNLPAGYHVVVVTDANGCAKKDSVLIQNIYTPFDVDLDTIQQVQCYGECNGEVVLSVTGAVGPYTFNWSTGQNYFGPGPDTLLNLCQGGHQVLISDAYGCDTVVSFIIAEPPMLYAIGSSIQPVQCFGLNDGQAFVYGTGGTGTNPSDYTYLWTPGDTISDPTLFPNLNDTVINLIPGIHTVIVTDTNGCTAADTVLITEPTQLFVDIPDSSATYSYCLPTYSGALWHRLMEERHSQMVHITILGQEQHNLLIQLLIYMLVYILLQFLMIEVVLPQMFLILILLQIPLFLIQLITL